MARPRRSARHRAFSARMFEFSGLAESAGRRVWASLAAYPGLSLAAGALIVSAALLGALVGPAPDGVDRVHASSLPLPPQPARVSPAEPAAPAIGENAIEENAVGLLPTGPAAREWQLVRVRPGQTLDRIFRELSLSPGLLHAIVNLDESTASLARIRPGDEFAFDFSAEGELRALRAELDDQRWLYVERQADDLVSRIEPRALDNRVVEASGTISSSLFNAAKAAGLTDNMTMRLATIFGWDVDFALDIRAGDQFAVIYEQIWRDGEFLRDGDILAARFVNQGEAFEAVRFDAGEGPDYFAPDGRPMRKAFLRAPLNFSYVTSNFNPRRFHPVTRRIRPHNGTDYGAPVGTPVWAAGDGRVIESAYNDLNGHYVFIQHGNNIVTKYLHLSRRQVSRGDRVRQGQTIGRVGATGRVTGAHLHYEFLLNGVHRNPRTVELPPANPLPSEQMDRFRSYGDGLLARLQAMDPGHGMQLAQQAPEDCPAGDCE